MGQSLNKTIVIGGGKVAARKVDGLLTAGAQVKVISPMLVPWLQSLVDSGRLIFLQRPYQAGDLEDAFLVIAATDDATVNQSIWLEAQQRGCLINIVDDPGHSNFTIPAVIHRGEMNISISTGGNSPALARRLRESIEKWIGPEYGLLTEVLGELRQELINDFSPGEARLVATLRVLDSDILNIIRTQGKEAALTYGREAMHQK